MNLSKFSYYEYQDTDLYWNLEEFKLNKINLIVGNNAAGKTRTLNVIAGLARILKFPQLTVQNGFYHSSILNKEKNMYDYTFELKNNSVLKEILLINGNLYVERTENGSGRIRNSNNDFVKFKIPFNQLAVSRRDEIQFPYLEDLFLWATSVKHIRFAHDEEKTTLAAKDANIEMQNNPRLAESTKVLEIFNRGMAEFKSEFTDNIIQDMNKIGYSLESISMEKLDNMIFLPQAEIFALSVKEKDRNARLNQILMSEGMFRALAILIHFNYYLLKKTETTILVDDIGEGLDYDRSSCLVKLLIKKAKDNNFQLLMSTNNKFIMNNTDLKYWQIITRKCSSVGIKNIHNSKQLFKEFKYTGLDNFDFYSGGFYKAKIDII